MKRSRTATAEGSYTTTIPVPSSSPAGGRVVVSDEPEVTPPPTKKQRRKEPKNGSVPIDILQPNKPPPYTGGQCDFQPEDKNPWVTDRSYDKEDAELVQFMGIPEPQHRCWGCINLNPISSIRKHNPAVEQTRLDHLITNLAASMNVVNINLHCLNLAQQFKEDIQIPTNLILKPGQMPLPEWNAATIKLHLKVHLSSNPLYKRQVILEQLDDVRNRSYEAAKEIHPVKKDVNGEPMKRVNPEQWKIMKEAIETEIKIIYSNFSTMMDNHSELRLYAQKNGSDFVDLSKKDVYYHLGNAGKSGQKTITAGGSSKLNKK